MISVIFSTRKANKKFINKIKSTCDLKDIDVIEIVNNGEIPLSQAYNNALDRSKKDIVVFCHDDLIFETKGWGRKILKHFERNPEYSIIGIAGTTELINGCWWSVVKSMVGVVGHMQKSKKWVNRYSEDFGDKIKEVVVLDGVFFAINKNKIHHKFDEDFKGFHFYDIPFFLSNYLDGVKIGVVTDFMITHLSIGITNKMWEENKKLFEEKYKDKLPVKLS
ncbi:MAG: glycosyltransferase [Desulfobacterales bacterium]|nr:glycosyltransferase [Desulfobacterales bacterium]MBF0396573.1 glycosyltransferase [Desulfobacterales bacterium]